MLSWHFLRHACLLLPAACLGTSRSVYNSKPLPYPGGVCSVHAYATFMLRRNASYAVQSLWTLPRFSANTVCQELARCLPPPAQSQYAPDLSD
ncbi:uncharacterized protein BT62DRAFT_939025 [Guyanagaster necrorhizus]|uniref:Secreted protein n=1 Tax=Guyanagaster necrorhizus TaxID=856835 RepID=A0A9P7VF60_9AGAR|nr:uncharacterized protein BT62DRAFT_939025 [Guyanagaster necrorhizus MCA 3950]KAG7439420.1 hypothetical protein BT62DRAFT_939025 [Guyanagaster necrorhizus MCA 3950]